MARTFQIITDLPVKTQNEVVRIQAIPSGQRMTSEAGFLTALGSALTNKIFSFDTDGLIVYASCVGTPPDAATGFKKGALIVQTNAGSTTKGLFTNTGDETSASWDLLESASTTDIADGAVTLAKMANMATASLIYRRTAATGVPEVNTLAQLKTDLNLFVLPTGTPVNAVAARATLTVTGGGTQIADGYKVTIDAKQYTFKTALTPTEGEVLIGISDTTALANLLAAINHTGTPDTDYKCAAVHPTVTGISSGALTLIVASKVKGVVGNALVSTVQTAAELSWDGTTLGTTVLGVNGTVGAQWSQLIDTNYLYVAIAANTIADANWRRISVGSVY